MEERLLDNTQETIETWAYVEIMGHSKIAGRVSERKVGVAVMLQVDVPNPIEGFAFSKLFSPSSIFSISPTTEEWCRNYVKSRVDYPVLPYIPESRQLPKGDEDADGFFHCVDDDEDPSDAQAHEEETNRDLEEMGL